VREINRIAIHHSAGPITQTVEQIRDWHVNGRGWSDVGYHYLIDYEGQIHEGRPVEKVGAHVKGWNKDSIGICLIGNFEEHPVAADQWFALEELLSHLMDLYDLDKDDVAGHKDFRGASTLCCGKHLHEALWDWKTTC